MTIENYKNKYGKWAVTGIGTDGKYADTRSGSIHRGIKERCHKGSDYQRKFPSYSNCSMSEEFLDFQFFVEWHMKQAAFGMDGFHIDKDILIPGNKVYSQDTCCLVPGIINLLMVRHTDAKTDMPLGVQLTDSKKYKAQHGKGAYLGIYKTKELAFAAYKNYKEAKIRDAVKLHMAVLEPRVYAALMSYEVLITDGE